MSRNYVYKVDPASLMTLCPVCLHAFQDAKKAFLRRADVHQQTKDICVLYEAGRMKDVIRTLRCHRCHLMDQLHESQTKVDCLDFLVYQIEKEQKNR